MDRAEQPFDVVEKPRHYNVHASGIEAIELTELLNANLSNALKYCWRRNDKRSALEDLKKALWYAKRHCENPVHVPIFATAALVDRFAYKAALVMKHETEGSLVRVVLQALADGEPKRMLVRIEEEIKNAGYVLANATEIT